jgi:hypothetical protein
VLCRQREHVRKTRTADYDKDPALAGVLNKHQTKGHGTHAESRATQTSGMDSKSSLCTASSTTIDQLWLCT